MADAPLRKVDVREKAISAAGAAFISAVIVNPLDVAKVALKPTENVFERDACTHFILDFFQIQEYYRELTTFCFRYPWAIDILPCLG